MNKTKKTYGQIIQEHRQANPYTNEDTHEYARQMGLSLMKDVHQTVAKALKKDLYLNKDFYIETRTKTERLTMTPETWVFARRSCPSAGYEQMVFKYHHQSASLELLWCIPERMRYWHIVRNPDQYLKSKDVGVADMAKSVLLMESGDLIDWIDKENGYKPDGLIVKRATP
jgi:hypothetical protein